LETDTSGASATAEALRAELKAERAGTTTMRKEALETARDLGRTVEALKGDLSRAGEAKAKAESEAARLKREMAGLKRETKAAPRRAVAKPAETPAREERTSIAERIRDLQKELPQG
jgi:predicted  nucleic acid-binding Zn-ribbon protein